MTNVILWPPAVKITGWEWSEEAPVSTSRSLLTGRRFVTATKRTRRVATVTASGLAGYGAGYMEALKTYLDGGVHLIQMLSKPNSLLSATGVIEYGPIFPAGYGLDSGGFPAVTMDDMAASSLVIAAGECIQVFDTLTPGPSDPFEIRRAARNTSTDSGGLAIIRITRAVTMGSVLAARLGGPDLATFEVVGDLPRATQPVGQDFSYEWQLREVFSDEIDSPTAVNPWA